MLWEGIKEKLNLFISKVIGETSAGKGVPHTNCPVIKRIFSDMPCA